MMSDSDFSTYSTNPLRPLTIVRRMVVGILVLVLIGIAWLWYLTSPSPLPETPLTLEIEKGMSVRTIARTAADIGLVHSELALYVAITSLYDPTSIHAGRYVFESPKTVFEVAEKIASNDVEETLIAITIPEGVRAEKIALLVADYLPDFNTIEFLEAATLKEGYLYPETYFVPEDFTAEKLFRLQLSTYEENIAPLRELIATTDFSEYELITLASIIEREANSEESMKMVSGILQNRLRIGMPLQADATIEYVLSDPLNELKPGELAQNLRELDSPYNTYKYQGLPPTPISNPGITAIMAALSPTPSDYLFYITDDDGVFHYAKTLQEHNNNIAKYLR